MNNKKQNLIVVITFSLLYLSTIILIILSIFNKGYEGTYLIPGIISFFYLWFYFFIKLIIKKNKEFVANVSFSSFNKTMRIIIYGITVLFFLWTIVSFISIFIFGGSAELIDGAYFVINHGEIVKQINYNQYQYLRLCDLYGWISIICGISTVFLFSKINELIEKPSSIA